MEGTKFDANLLVLKLAYSTEAEIREFCGEYLHHIRKEDHVLALKHNPGNIVTDEYAAPWRGDILVKPVSAPDSMPLVIPGVNKWARDLFGGAGEGEAPQAAEGTDRAEDDERTGVVVSD